MASDHRRLRHGVGRFIIAAFAFTVLASVESAQTTQPQHSAPAASAADQQLLRNTENFLRNLFAWGPTFQVDLGPLSPSPSPDFYTVPIKVTVSGQSDTGTVYVSKDGKTFVRGEMFDTTKNPFADNLAKLHVGDSPAKGPADAAVTIYEFSDFECPHCRVLHTTLQQVETENPKVRVVFKNFPINQIHPWAETAAIGARCAYIQKPDAFWTVHDLIFDNQDVISTENIWDKLISFAAQANLDAESFKSCLSSPEAKQAVDADRKEGESLNVTSTPTVYINGRPLIGGDKPTLDQYIHFAGQAQGTPAPPASN
jgi:protein-disulfide isomerase